MKKLMFIQTNSTYKKISSYNHNFGKVDNFKFISKISLEKTRDSKSGDSNEGD